MSNTYITNIQPEKLKHLLSATKRIVKHHHKLSIAKGEHFNIFSVLKLETKEDKTHSAFLAELLNPNGSHKLGDVFLKLFLEVIDPFDEEKENTQPLKETFITNGAAVTTEFYISEVDLKKETGGRIDIYLKDKNDKIISIENKIYAPDQPKQVKRYYNHKTEKNTVFYLTLNGKDPSKNSRQNLISDEHFYNLSYKEHIVKWLELCLREVPNFSSLREAINQYILLIKKLTKTMNKDHQEELLKIMMTDIEAASYVANNYETAVQELKENFRTDVINVLKEKLNNDFYTIEEGKPVSNKISQIWIHLKSKPQPEFFFGIESFSGSGHKNGNMFVGIFSHKKAACIAALPEENKIGSSWKQVRFIKTKDLNFINLSHNFTIKILNNTFSDEYKTLLKNCCNQIIRFVEDYQEKLPKELFISTEKQN